MGLAFPSTLVVRERPLVCKVRGRVTLANQFCLSVKLALIDQLPPLEAKPNEV